MQENTLVLIAIILKYIFKQKRGCQELLTFSFQQTTKKTLIYNSIVKSTVTYGAETWKFYKNLESKLMSMEMDKSSARCSRLEKNINNVIREKFNIKNSVLDFIRYEQLNWSGQVQRMDEKRLPLKILEWCPPGRRRKGRPQNSWMEEVTIGMGERGINNLEWLDRDGRRRKIKPKL